MLSTVPLPTQRVIARIVGPSGFLWSGAASAYLTTLLPPYMVQEIPPYSAATSLSRRLQLYPSEEALSAGGVLDLEVLSVGDAASLFAGGGGVALTVCCFVSVVAFSFRTFFPLEATKRHRGVLVARASIRSGKFPPLPSRPLKIEVRYSHTQFCSFLFFVHGFVFGVQHRISSVLSYTTVATARCQVTKTKDKIHLLEIRHTQRKKTKDTSSSSLLSRVSCACG